MPYVLPCIRPFAIYVRGNLKSLLVFNKKSLACCCCRGYELSICYNCNFSQTLITFAVILDEINGSYIVLKIWVIYNNLL